MKKLFMSLATVLIMIITGCGSSSNSAPEPLSSSSEKNIPRTVTVSPSLSGSLDTTFGTNGIVNTPIGSSYDGANALGIQSDGRIVVAGSSSNGSNYDFAIARYGTDGSLDTTFGAGGIVTTNIGSGDDVASALGIQSDGRIVVAGKSGTGSNYDFALVRYNTDGSLDTGFGTGGKVTTPIGSDWDIAYALGIQSDGRIVAAGYSSNGDHYDFALVRYNTDGSLDTRFGAGGKVTTSVGSGYDRAFALVIQSDGRIVVAGTSSSNGSKYDFALVRYNTDGSLDTRFGTGGKVTTLTGSGNGAALALGIQSDGRILAAGYSSNGGNYNYAIARYNTDGSLDTGFGTGGIVTTPAGSGYDRAYALGIQPDGRIVVAGTSSNGSNYNFVLMRYDTDGSLDTRFGTGFDIGYDKDSKVITTIGSVNDASPQSKSGSIVVAVDSGINYYYATALGMQSDGRIVAAGYSDNGIKYDFSLMRYLP